MRIWAFPGVEAEALAADGAESGFSPSAGCPAAPAHSAVGTAPLLEIRDLSHWFQPPRQRRRIPGQPVLDGISLRVDAGEIVVLLGPSGCGKSTLLNLASGLNPRQQGKVSLEGEDIFGPDPRLGLVFQQPALLPWLSVRGNVAFGLTLRHSERLSSSQRRERIQRTLQLVGLQIDPETMPAHLSGGMAQRVALARVLVRHPRLLLLDEPFSALDAITRAEMQELLLRITAQTGAGMLIVTHDVDEAIQLGDRILLMRAKPGAVEREWIGRRAAHEQERHALRREILKELSDILKSRSP
jgi:NitT/TauT family transport system ATP-binding protein